MSDNWHITAVLVTSVTGEPISGGEEERLDPEIGESLLPPSASSVSDRRARSISVRRLAFSAADASSLGDPQVVGEA